MSRWDQKIDELTRDNRDFAFQRVLPASESDLREVETALGHVLPPGYREFLRDYGGIRFGGNQCRRAAVYHLADSHFGRASFGDCYDKRELLEVFAKSQGYAPPELINIAENGNVLLYLAIAGKNIGNVYQWYPDPYPEKLDYYPELELVSRSFDDFMASLKPLKERFYEDPAHYETEENEILAVLETLSNVQLPKQNRYCAAMKALDARYVYSTLGEDTPSLTETEFSELEESLGCALPQDYREFLKSFGGYGFLPRKTERGFSYSSAMYPYFDKRMGFKTQDFLSFFHGYMANDFHDLLAHHERLRGYLPAGFLPIAEAGQVCMKLTGPGAGAVFTTDHDVKEFSHRGSYGGPSDPLCEEDLEFVASSFDEFIRLLWRPKA